VFKYLYSANKEKRQNKKDKSSVELDYEQNAKECTFQPNLSLAKKNDQFILQDRKGSGSLNYQESSGIKS